MVILFYGAFLGQGFGGGSWVPLLLLVLPFLLFCLLIVHLGGLRTFREQSNVKLRTIQIISTCIASYLPYLNVEVSRNLFFFYTAYFHIK